MTGSSAHCACWDMLVGATLYAEAFPVMNKTVLARGNFGRIALPGVLGVNHWILIVPLVAGGIYLFR
jgi:hypothetical protein